MKYLLFSAIFLGYVYSLLSGTSVKKSNYTMPGNSLITLADTAGNCPVCKRKDMVIPIRYGKPGRELTKQTEEGKVKLGGCMVSEKSPKFYCKRDSTKF